MKAKRLNSLLRAGLLVAAAVSLTLVPACSKERPEAGSRQVIMLGFDGMDPKLAEKLMAEGLMPNFARLAKQGGFKPLQTSTPPQSPVAWSSIITGTNPGEHGIFDFIHRNPKTYMPMESTSMTEDADWRVRMGKWVIPLSSGRVINMRHGAPFWEFLTRNGIDAHIYRIPANFPPEPSKGPGEFLTLTDMGTPDLAGTLGQFSFYTSGPFRGAGNVSGGKVYRIRFVPLGGNRAETAFYGPSDPLLNPEKVGSERAGQPLEAPVTIIRDKVTDSAIIEWQDKRLLLSAGEWSDWQTVEFDLGPEVLGVHGQSIAGRMRMYLRRVDPVFEMYVTPLQMDPAAPAQPVSVPDDFSQEVAEKIGTYFTQGLPEDTQALRHSALTRDEFLQQAEMVYQERLKLLDFALGRFDAGFLFFYFGSTDQIGHMFWGALQEHHPAMTDEEIARYKDVMRDIYVRVDAVVGKVMERFPEATILCISDHGFADFSRGFNVNTWLVENGYAALKEGANRKDIMSFDWSKTKAYAVGINGIYINLRGRESQGIVDPMQKRALMDEIKSKLLQVVDPETGERVIKEVYLSHEVYHGSQIDRGPDMQVGYALGYRSSWSTGLGGTPRDVLVEDNTEAWCGDHCIATDLVPGVIFTNQRIELERPTLEDLAPTVLKEFNIEPPPVMEGQSVFEKRQNKG